MEEALSCIGKMPIFSGIREEELYTLIKCCDGQMAVFEKDQWIFQAGEELGYIMVVLKGRLAIIHPVTAPVHHLYLSHVRPERSLLQNVLFHYLQVPGSLSHLPDLLMG